VIYSLYDLIMLVFFSTLVLSLLLIIITYIVLKKVLVGASDLQEDRVYTILRCPLCNYTIRRLYRPGDYVGKVANETCPTHNTKLIVYEIFRETLTE